MCSTLGLDLSAYALHTHRTHEKTIMVYRLEGIEGYVVLLCLNRPSNATRPTYFTVCWITFSFICSDMYLRVWCVRGTHTDADTHIT